MKAEELNQKLKNYNHRMAVGLIAPAIICTVALFATVGVSNLLKEEGYHNYSWILMLVLIFDCAVFIAFLIYQSKKNEDRIPKCPICKNKLPINTIHIIIATGKCTMCGNKIIEKSEQNESPDQNPAPRDSGR